MRFINVVFTEKQAIDILNSKGYKVISFIKLKKEVLSIIFDEKELKKYKLFFIDNEKLHISSTLNRKKFVYREEDYKSLLSVFMCWAMKVINNFSYLYSAKNSNKYFLGIYDFYYLSSLHSMREGNKKLGPESFELDLVFRRIILDQFNDINKL